eukprot:m.236016 g.236016  ORF g.236016 m.236016 type:complete len:106 (+) comp13918_c1_seq4:4796-5113(+)
MFNQQHIQPFIHDCRLNGAFTTISRMEREGIVGKEDKCGIACEWKKKTDQQQLITLHEGMPPNFFFLGCVCVMCTSCMSATRVKGMNKTRDTHTQPAEMGRMSVC